MAARRETRDWSRWYYGMTHLEVYKGGSCGGGTDRATIQRFPSGGCTLWMYNTHDKNLWTGNPTVYYKSVEEAMGVADKRLGVRGIPPVYGEPANHPNNPPRVTPA